MSFKTTLFGVLAVCVSAASALATSSSTKIKDFEPQGVGLVLNPRADGMAMISFDPSIAGSVVHLRVNGLQPFQQFGVAIQATTSAAPDDYNNPQAFCSNWRGDGSFEISLPTVDLGAAPIFYIYVWDGNTDPDSIADITITELRMVGTADIDESPVVKIKDFDPAGTGTCANPWIDGMAVLNYSTILGGSDVHLHLTRLTPNTQYGVGIQATSSTDVDYSSPQAFCTNAFGAGSFDVLVPAFDFGSDPIVYIYVWDGNFDPDSITDITATELRAIGAREQHHHHGCQFHGCNHH